MSISTSVSTVVQVNGIQLPYQIVETGAPLILLRRRRVG